MRRGQIVEIRTVNRGCRGPATNVKRKPVVVTWTGRVIGPSPLGHDLWLIKGMKRHGKTVTYTVPRQEIQA